MAALAKDVKKVNAKCPVSLSHDETNMHIFYHFSLACETWPLSAFGNLYVKSHNFLDLIAGFLFCK